MVEADEMEVALAFEGALEQRSDALRRMVPTVPALAGDAFAGAQIALESASSTLLLSVRLAGERTDDAVERLRFWCARAGGWTAVPSTASELVQSAWRGRLLACRRTFYCATAAELGSTLDEMLGRGSPPARPPVGPTLDVDVRGPGAAGMAYNSDHRLLFVPGHLAPPIGDELELALRVSGSVPPVRCWGRVVRVRRAAQGLGTPAGFVVQLGVTAPPVAEALASCCVGMNSDAMVEEARREAPRFAVRVAVEVERCGGAIAAVARRNEPATGHAVSLSVGGAFIATSRRESPGASVLVRFRLTPRESFAVPATVVYGTGKGIGVKFEVRDEPVLCRLLARLSARPRRVLVVDDDRLVREMLSDTLAGLGYEILSASSGDDAVRVLASELYALDAIVTDLRMEGLDGSQLVAAVNGAREHIEIVIVVVSGGLDVDVTDRLCDAGADAVLDKALRPDRLAAEIDALIERRWALGGLGSAPATAAPPLRRLHTESA
jgi:CheY-like chemotaxis protein